MKTVKKTTRRTVIKLKKKSFKVIKKVKNSRKKVPARRGVKLIYRPGLKCPVRQSKLTID